MRINIAKLEALGYHVDVKVSHGNVTDVNIHPRETDHEFVHNLEVMLRDKVGKYSMLLAEDLCIEVSNLQILKAMKDDEQ